MTNVAANSTNIMARDIPRSDLTRWFYPTAGLVLLVLTVWGFRHFFFHGQSHPGRPITPPIRTLIIVHGCAMSVWIILFTLQPWLAALRRKKLHMMLGQLGIAVAAAVFGLGMMVGVSSARVAPPDFILWDLNRTQFMAVPLFSVVAFAAFVTVAILKRRQPAIHKPMMLCGTLAVMGAAISRIDVLSNLYIGTVWERAFGPFFMTVVLALVLLGVRCAITRSFDRWLALGVTLLIAIAFSTMAIARTDVWTSFASLLVQ
ncbi:MAG: hypothetical protein KF691_08900 [Phycisphaeraceae bacterium]|nr:hypothetical protein [Phycisphaeraceae bacterium]